MRIQHNIPAMNAYRNYNNNTSALSKNLEKLSSGYKINRAGDDAAGLAISEKMRAQITGLNAAQKNVKDGISLVKTAEGAMQEIHDMLNRMSYLATQSANGTYDNEVDRLNLQKEVTALKDEINRIADSANFNGINLLDGDMEIKTTTSYVSPDGGIDASMNIDGQEGTIGGKAKVEIVMGNSTTAAAATPLTPTSTVEGTQASVMGTKATVTFTLADSTNAGATDAKLNNTVLDENTGIDDLGNIIIGGGKKISDLFDLDVGGTATDWKDASGNDVTTALGTSGTTITLTAKANGNLGDTVKTAFTGATAANITYTPGKDVGETTAPQPAKYEISLTMSNLSGGQKIELGGKTIKVTADPTQTNASLDGSGVGTFVLTGDATQDTANLVAAMNATFTDFTAASTADGKITLTAKNTDATGNQGSIRFYDANGQDMGANVVNYNRYTPAPTAGATQYAQVNYAVNANDLKAGAEITVGGTTIKIIADGEAEDAANGKYTETNVKDNLASLIESSASFQGGKVNYASGVLTITSAVKGQTANAFQNATAGKVSLKAAPSAPVEATDASNQKITTGTTTVQDLMDRYGDTYTIKVEENGAGGTDQSGDATYTIKAGDKITFEARIAGKMGNNLLNFSGVSQTKTDGYDEGQSGNTKNTHYDITFDLTKLAGGQSFTFGNVNGQTKTFEISLDGTSVGTHDTDNGAIGSGSTEVADRVLIDLSQVDLADASAVANKIKTAVDSGIGGSAWNYDTDVNGNTIKLTMDAKTGTNDTNMGNVRFTAAGKGITGSTYNPYVASEGDRPGTYAQVTWNLDLSKLQSGDTLKIGDTTVKIGDQAKIEVNAQGNVTGVVVAERDASNSAKIIEAFETAGYKSGRLQFDSAGKKMTITGIKAGETAVELAGGNGKVVFTPDAAKVSAATSTTGGLILQIGDTADGFNQMKVSVGDMHTSAMGSSEAVTDAGGNVIKDAVTDTIDSISIGTQGDAQKAIQVIKNAINYVSGIRGDLGAVQNRLEHTQNNLSVMAENIQDAESTIRDTDVAEEMMSYVKNNILVQSAQAMLAQANQLPQGVLQLLG